MTEYNSVCGGMLAASVGIVGTAELVREHARGKGELGLVALQERIEVHKVERLGKGERWENKRWG